MLGNASFLLLRTACTLPLRSSSCDALPVLCNCVLVRLVCHFVVVRLMYSMYFVIVYWFILCTVHTLTLAMPR